MDGMTIAEKFGVTGLLIAAIVLLGKLLIASNERVSMERIKADREIAAERTKVEDKRADASVAALSMLSGKIDAHHTADIQSHQRIGELVSEIRGKLDEAIGWQERTPVGGGPFPAQVRDRPSQGIERPGEYSSVRPSTKR